MLFMNNNLWTPPKISLRFIPKASINNIPPLVQIMAWRQSGDKPSSEPMMVRLLMHICVTRPQWVNTLIVFVLVTQGERSAAAIVYPVFPVSVSDIKNHQVHFYLLSFIVIAGTRVFENCPHRRQRRISCTKSTPWLPMTWWLVIH